MFKIKTPNNKYNGTTYGVDFVNGIGETENEEIKNVLVHEFGYELIVDTDKKVKEEKKSIKKK